MPAVTLEPCRPSTLVYGVRVAFEGDERMKDYHISGSSSHSTLYMHTYHRIIAECQNGKARHYKVLLCGSAAEYRKHKVIGYVTIFLEPALMLYSFGINIEHRKPWILKAFMKRVHKLFKGQTYHAGLYEKNRRAIQFLEKNGFEKTVYNAHDKSYFLCHSSEV